MAFSKWSHWISYDIDIFFFPQFCYSGHNVLYFLVNNLRSGKKWLIQHAHLISPNQLNIGLRFSALSEIPGVKGIKILKLLNLNFFRLMNVLHASITEDVSKFRRKNVRIFELRDSYCIDLKKKHASFCGRDW